MKFKPKKLTAKMKITPSTPSSSSTVKVLPNLTNVKIVPKVPVKYENRRSVSNPITIEVNVYRLLGVFSIWHTGTVLRHFADSDAERTAAQSPIEYYFHVTNRVESCKPNGFSGVTHRTLTRQVQGDWNRVMGVFEQVRSRWNGTRYDLFQRNCNLFTHDLLTSLGARGLDEEYRNSSGMRNLLNTIPGSSTFQEVLKPVFGMGDGTIILDKAVKEDIVKLLKVMFPGVPLDNAVKEFDKLHAKAKKGMKQIPGKVTKWSKAAGGKVATGAKQAGGKVASTSKQAAGKVATGAKQVGGKVASSGKQVGSKTLKSFGKFGGKVAGGAKQAGGQVSSAVKKTSGSVASGAKQVGGAVSSGAKKVGGAISGGAKKLKWGR